MENTKEIWIPMKEAYRRGLFKVSYPTLKKYSMEGLIEAKKTYRNSPLWVNWYSVPVFLRREVSKKTLKELQNYQIKKPRKKSKLNKKSR